MADPASRGWLVGHHAIFLVFGYMLAGWIGFAVYFAPSEFSWRFPLCFQILPPLILLAGSPWVPRSPRWLASKGHVEEAYDVLRKLRKSPDDPNDLAAKEEMFQIKEQLRMDANKLSAYGGSPWKAVVQKKSYRKRMIIGFLTQWGAEFGGPLIIVRPGSFFLLRPDCKLMQIPRTTMRSYCTQTSDRLATCRYCSRHYG